MKMQLDKRFLCIVVAILMVVIIMSLKDDPFQTFAENKLINLTDFKYVLKSKVCEKVDGILGVFIITSYVGHDKQRLAHRQAMPSKQLADLGFVRVFLIASIPAHDVAINQSGIVKEHKRFDDLVQGNFVDNYRNLSYTNTMGLRWAAVDCAKSKFIIKVDDDMVFDLFKLYNFLLGQEENELHLTNSFLAGSVSSNIVPHRLNTNKWYVTRKEYSGSMYPDFLFGWFYLTNGRTAKRLVEQAGKEPFFWIDDVWLTGVLRELLHIPLVSLNGWFSVDSQFLDCCIEDVKRLSVKCQYHVGIIYYNIDNTLIHRFREIEKCYSRMDKCVDKRTDQKLCGVKINKWLNV